MGAGGLSSGIGTGGGGLGSFAPAPGAFTTPFGAYGAPPAPATAPPPVGVAPLEIPTVPPAWLLTPSIQLGEAFNDNVNLAPKGSTQWDFITTVTPGLNLVGQSGRITLNLTYDPTEMIFARTAPTSEFQQHLLGTGRVELWQDTLFIDSSAAIDQAFLRPTGAIAPTTLTTSNNLQTVYTETVSPYLLQHLGSYADSESRYRFSSVNTSGNTIAPELTHELRQSFVGGEAFDRFGWQLLGDATRLERGQAAGDPFSGITSKDELLRSDYRYPVYQSFSLIGGVGYERITDPTLSTQPKGVIWDVGFSYQPNPLVFVSLTYGERFDRNDIEFNATYNLDPQLRVSAIYTQTIQTSQSQIAGNVSQLTLGPGGTLINAQTGLPVTTLPATGTLSTSASPFGVSSGSFLAKTAALDATLLKERNTYTARLYASKESGGTTIVNGVAIAPGTNVVTAERIYGTLFGWSHLLRADLTANANAGYYRTVFLDGSGRHDNVYTFGLGLTYDLSRTTTATLSLSRSDQRSNIPVDSLTDDIVLATIRKTF